MSGEIAGLYASLVSEGGRSWIDAGGKRPQLSEQAILFTDIRLPGEVDMEPEDPVLILACTVVVPTADETIVT